MKWIVERFGLVGAPRDALFALFVLSGLNAVDELDQSAVMVLGPEIREEFGLSIAAITVVGIALVPVVLLLTLPLGFAADHTNRVRLAGGGALVWATMSIGSGLAPTFVAFVALRSFAGVGRSVNRPAHQSLIADYFKPTHRAGAYAIWNMANPLGRIVGALAAGFIASRYGWRTPLLLLAVPTFVFVALATRLTEPIRGAHERRAAGADADVVATEEPAPSWDESWRTLQGVESLQRVWRALPFLVGALLGYFILLPFYWAEVFDVNEIGRGALAAVNEPFSILGLVAGVSLAKRLLDTDPARIFQLFGLIGFVLATGLLALAIAPTVWVAAVVTAMLSLVGAVLVPGFAAVTSLVTPPRARGMSFSIAELWVLPGLFFAVAGGLIGDRFGLRAGMVAMVPVFAVGSLIVASAGVSVRRDITRARHSSAVLAAHRLVRDQGGPTVLTCRDISATYGLTTVLRGVDLEARDGEIVALLGPNGAGKSTLLRCIAGLHLPDSGVVVVDGTDITFASAQTRTRRGVALMPGGRAVFDELTVLQNLNLALWQHRTDEDVRERAIESAFRRFPILRARCGELAGALSGGEQQMLGLSMALVTEPSLLLIDELTLGLSPRIVDRLLDTIRELRRGGTTIVLVDQSVQIALRVASRVVCLDRGTVCFAGDPAEMLQRPDLLKSVFLAGASSHQRGAAGPGEDGTALQQAGASLELDNVSAHYGGIAAVDELSMKVEPGEIVGIIGPNGAGKTTLIDLIAGVHRVDSGVIKMDGCDITDTSAQARVASGLGRLFQDARLFASMTVTETVAVARLTHLEHRDMTSIVLALPRYRRDARASADRVAELIDQFGLQRYANMTISELSTGTRRIVDLACAVALEPTVLLLDEPSAGMAQPETEMLGPLLLSVLQWSGATIVIVEHNIALVSSVADRLIALDRGRVIANGSADNVLSNPEVMASYYGVAPTSGESTAPR